MGKRVSLAVFAFCYIVFILSAAKIIENSAPAELAAQMGEYNRQFGIRDEKMRPLAKWDTQWFINVARFGYAETVYNAAHNANFLPLYPLLIRATARLGINHFTAASLVSETAFLLAVLLLYHYSRHSGQDERGSWAAAAALLAFPTAFILVSPYAESLFLVYVIATFYFYRRNKTALAAASAFAAGLTRMSGLALAPAFLVPILIDWRRGKLKWRQLFIPLAPAAALLLMMLYNQVALGDAFKYFKENQTWFGRAGLSWPWQAIQRSWETTIDVWQKPTIGTAYVLLEFPVLLLLLAAATGLLQKRKVPEAVFVAANIGLVLVSGSLWGLPRYAAVIFPLFIFLAEHRDKKAIWYGYLFLGIMLQILMLTKFVLMKSPAI